VAALGRLLDDAPEDPFAVEVVSVASRGMERWLSQQLSGVLGARADRADGICANIQFPSPARLIGDSVATATGLDPASDPWLPERLVWPLLELTTESLSEPWLAPLASYLGADRDPPDPVRAGRRLTILRRLASHLYRYALHRPDMLAAWRDGRDEDGTGAGLAAPARWQAELWRRLTRRIPVPDPATRMAAACRIIESEPGRLELAPRLSAFGLTRLAAGSLQVLRALSVSRDVHLFLLHPSPALWEEVQRHAPGPPGRGGIQQASLRSADDSGRLVRHRLLASWGRDAREMQIVLRAQAPAACDHHHSPAAVAGATLLSHIQDDVRANRPAPGAPLPDRPDRRLVLDPADRSVQLHACHGHARQVEVVREAILHALADDPTLEPRDVIVMCPDIEGFAPLIQATFGTPEVIAQETEDSSARAADGRPNAPAPIDLRVRLADRSLRQTNPLLGLVAALLDLADRRVTASEVLDLAGRGPVRRRFGLDDDDLQRLAGWVAQAGVRWGLDAAHRRPYRLENLESGTWRAGLDRILLGVTMTEDGDRLFADVLPLDDVDSRGIELAGRLAELVERLGGALSEFRRQPLDGWARAIAQATDALGACAPRDRWQRSELARLLDAARPSCRSSRCVLCSPTAWPAGPPGRTSAPAI
jgi:exodeoxyribonuclease V gamma subunit